MRETFAGLSLDRFPNVTTLAGVLTTGGGDERFAFAVDTFIDGLIARSQPGKPHQ